MTLRFAALVALLVTGAALAGCSSKPAAKPDDALADLGLEATDETGIIRGVVLDSAIHPIRNATIAIQGAMPMSTASNADGAFGFEGLAPGNYFLSASKAGFITVQQSVEVVAGVNDPAAVKIQLAADSSFVAPYFQQFILDGFIECGVTTPAVAGAVCSFGEIAGLYNLTNDNFGAFVPVEAVPMWIQHELVWEATQSTGNQFKLVARSSTSEQHEAGTYEAGITSATGVSPVMIQINATVIEDFDLGVDGTGLAPAVFSGGMDGTSACTPDPAPEECFFGTGATVAQKFQLYTHVFYGYEPPVGWRFSDDSEVPQPPEG